MSSKALIGGYVADSNWIIITEIRRLLDREKVLEQQIERLREENASFATRAKEIHNSPEPTTSPDETAKRVESISATVEALTEIVAQLATNTASTPGHEISGSRDTTAELLTEIAASRPALSKALQEGYAEERRDDAGPSRNWQRIAGIVGVGSLLDLHGSATAAALERVFNQARGIAVSRLDVALHSSASEDPGEES